MRLITFDAVDGDAADGPFAGALVANDGRSEAVAVEAGEAALTAVERLLEGGAAALSSWRERVAEGGLRRFAREAVRLRAPIPAPRRAILCVGKNYRDHAAEFHKSGFDATATQAMAEAPVIFAKAASSVIADGEPIVAGNDPTATVDYEGELAVVIGRRIRRVRADEAWQAIAGYTIVNDVTSRALQKRHAQWYIGKSVDSFCPMGPALVTADEIEDIARSELITRVNDDIRQRASVRDLIFDIPTLIETLSLTMTLVPGDIIATGTPAGVGIGFDPPRYLEPGDQVEVSISGLGTLANPVR